MVKCFFCWKGFVLVKSLQGFLYPALPDELLRWQRKAFRDERTEGPLHPSCVLKGSMIVCSQILYIFNVMDALVYNLPVLRWFSHLVGFLWRTAGDIFQIYRVIPGRISFLTKCCHFGFLLVLNRSIFPFNRFPISPGHRDRATA